MSVSIQKLSKLRKELESQLESQGLDLSTETLLLLILDQLRDGFSQTRNLILALGLATLGTIIGFGIALLS